MNRLYLLVIFALTTLAGYSQPIATNFYDSTWKKTDSVRAAFYEVIHYTDTAKKAGTVKLWLANGTPKSAISYSDIAKYKRHGSELIYHPNGQLKSQCWYSDGKLDGEVITYYASGQVKRKDKYQIDSLITGQCFSSTGKDTAWFPYLINAGFKGGYQEMFSFVLKHFRYPKKAIQIGIEGQVMIEFRIGKNGEVSHEKIISRTDPMINEEALRIFHLMHGRWLPAQLDGEPVMAYLRMPVLFKLTDK
jgi:periplasmic protein TonB